LQSVDPYGGSCDIKAAAKKLAAQGVTTKAAALAEAAAKYGAPTWAELESRGWSLDEDGDIGAAAACKMPGNDFKIQVYSPLLDFDALLDLDETWSVNVSLSTRYTPYLYVSFVSAYDGSNFDLDEGQKEAFEKAIGTGSKADAILAQAALIEDVLGWFDKDWVEMTTQISAICGASSWAPQMRTSLVPPRSWWLWRRSAVSQGL